MYKCVTFFTAWWYIHNIGNNKCSLIGNLGFPGGLDSKESAYNEGDLRSVPGLGRFPGEGNGNTAPVFLPGEIPWAEEPGGLQSMGSRRARHD